MRKKIVFTVTNDLTYDQRMHRICTSLATEGYDVLLVGRQLPESVPLEDRSYKQVRLRPFFRKGKVFYLEYNIRLLLYLLRIKWDGVCAIDLDTLAPCFLASKIRKRPCVYDAHEYFSEVPEVQDRPLTKTVWELLARTLIPKVRFAYTVGPMLARILSDRYKTEFQVIRNVPYAVAEFREPASLPSEPFTILYQGVLNEGRGLEVAIESVAKLSGVKLVIYGEGDLSEELRALAGRLKLGDKVVFKGKLPPEKLRSETPKAHVGLNLLEAKSLNYYYSLANKAFDYIQAGVPSICMDFPEYRELNEKYGVFHLLPELSVEQLTASILELKENREYLGKLRMNCRKAAKDLTWEKEEKKLLTFWQAVFTDG
ncbi:MAG: glycosyltransferase [Saprospiraceae bacterium]